MDEEDQIQLDIICLEILRALIYDKYKNINQEDQERNPARYRKYFKNNNFLLHCEMSIYLQGLQRKTSSHPKTNPERGNYFSSSLYFHNVLIRILCVIFHQVIPLLSHPNERIVNEVLALLQALLVSGNVTVQNEFIKLVRASSENPLFPKLQTMLRRAAKRYHKCCK